jgi:hypothetical protein
VTVEQFRELLADALPCIDRSAAGCRTTKTLRSVALGECSCIACEIGAALAEPPAPEWRFVDGKMEADLGEGWCAKISAYSGRIAWSVHRASDDAFVVGHGVSLDEAKAAALAATKGE